LSIIIIVSESSELPEPWIGCDVGSIEIGSIGLSITIIVSESSEFPEPWIGCESIVKSDSLKLSIDV